MMGVGSQAGGQSHFFDGVDLYDEGEIGQAIAAALPEQPWAAEGETALTLFQVR
jgi:hypothetical protein